MLSGKTELAIFDDIPPQGVVESGIFQDIHPSTAIDTNTTVITFLVQGSQSEYLDLNDTLISLRLKITKADGTMFGAADKVQAVPTNYFMNALFSDVMLEMNDVTVEGGGTLYPYKSTIESMLNYGDDAKRLQLLPAGVSSEEKERAKWGKNSATFELVGALRLDFLTQSKYLIPGVNVRVTLTRTKDEFALQLPTGTADDGSHKFKINIDQCILYVRRVKVHPSVERAHQKTLSSKNAIYPYTKTKTLYYGIPAGTQSFIKENIFTTGRLPKFIVIGMVRSDAFNGNLEHPPFKFEHFNVTSIGLFRDGQAIPYKRSYNLNTNSKLVTDAYVRSILQNTQLLNTNNGNGIDMNDFANKGYCFFTFNLTPDFDMNMTQLPTDGNLRLDIRFGTPLAQPINVIAYAIYDSKLLITNDRAVITDAY